MASELVDMSEVAKRLIAEAKQQTTSPAVQENERLCEDPRLTKHAVIGQMPIPARWLFNLSVEIAIQIVVTLDEGDRKQLLFFQNLILIGMVDSIKDAYPNVEIELGIVLKNWHYAIAKDRTTFEDARLVLQVLLNAPTGRH